MLQMKETIGYILIAFALCVLLADWIQQAWLLARHSLTG